jgi:outer membrane cobalamin receptor
MIRGSIRVRVFLSFLVLSCVLNGSFDAHAQARNVSVGGTIKDVSGGVLAGATVTTVVAGGVVAETTSGENGQYRLEVPAGVPFELRVRREGFADFSAGLRGANADVTRDVTLQIGGVSDTLVVTASRGSESRANVTESVTVATAEDIHSMGATQLSDVLRFVPGTAVEGNGREGAVTSFFSRGGESDYNLVLIDGVRVNQQGGAYDFSRVSANEIERVEVVRGAQSALWGSDAMGSVVQVFTRHGLASAPTRVSGSVEGGSFDSWRSAARVSGGARGMVAFNAGMSYRKTDGAFADILPEDDWFEQTGFEGSVGVRLGSRANVRSSLRYSHAQGRNPGNITYGARNSGFTHDTKDLSWNTDVAHTAGDRYSGTATVNYFRYHSVVADTIGDPDWQTFAILEGTPGALFPDGVRLVRLIDEAEFDALEAAGGAPGPGQFIAEAFNSDFPFNPLHTPSRFRRPAIRYQGDYAWAAGQRLSAGYEWERESILPQSPAATVSLDNNAFFVQQQTTIADRWFVTFGVRVDSKESFDTFVSPKLSAGAFVVPHREGGLSSVKVFGNIGKGIKAPTFGERFGGGFADPNPDLEVERARTADLGVEATFGSERVRGMATYFNNDYKDQIAFRPGIVGDGIPENININGSQAQGWEFEVALQKPAGGFTAGATYAYVDTEVVENLSSSTQFQPGQPLLRRPKHSGTIRAAYAIGPATVSFDVRMVGERHDNSFLFMNAVPNAQFPDPDPFSTDITVNPGYAVAGLGLDYRIDRSLPIYVRGNNITDTEYDSALGYPGLPRSVVVGAQFNLGR